MSIANISRSFPTGGLSTAITGGVNGSIIDYIQFKAEGITNPGTLRIFINPVSPTGSYLFDEVITTGITPTGNLSAELHTYTPPGSVPFNVPPGVSLQFATNNAETWNVFMHGGNF